MRHDSCITRRDMLRRLAGGIALLLLAAPVSAARPGGRRTVLHGSTILLEEDLAQLGLAPGGAGERRP